ncbi:LacI family transcriptional regulator [Motilibacter rhizosphaerae]|uniref:LacI family transcriptional regulator n=1 Tax=Motilibacter rhizosphaerae TaxID=598652 RepID=A0A4Q7NW76_9ACTN|nr:LacI family DNA-binding transcriptional regulator [Motilibacter rhizosphaerae]RZS91260.1 LacI family transcriptional regulator [Motilibacter rhizosphaerae]
MATLADVARLSATSRSTASRALKNDPRISAATAERVRLVAAALHYQPNLAARSLTTGRSGILGLVLPTTALTGDPYGAQLVNAVTTGAMDRDRGVMLWLSHDRPGGAVSELLSGSIIDGLVISIIALGDAWVQSLLEGPVPVVLVGRPPQAEAEEALSWVAVDNAGGTAALLAHLREEGYERIATIRGPVGNTDADERHAAYVAALGGEAAVDANLVAVGDFGYESGYAAAQRLLARRPDCIVAANDHAALGAVDAITDAGLSIPGDVAVAGWDDVASLRRRGVELTTVRQDVEAVGREAVAILLELLDGDAEGPVRRVLPTELVVRESTRRPAGGPMSSA